jgi:hypothetical protein
MSTNSPAPKVHVEFVLKGSFALDPETFADLQAELDGKPMIKDINGSLVQALFTKLHRYHAASTKTGRNAKGKTATVDITLLPGKTPAPDA